MQRLHKRLLAACAAVAVMGVMGAGFAIAQDEGGEGPGKPVGSPAAINTNLVPEAKFVPVTPCRLLDTRSAGGRIAPNTVRGFDAFGGNLSSQGGSGSGCGIPSHADAIQVNLTAVDPLGTGFLRGAAQNGYLIINGDPGTSQTLPNATLLNYSSALNASNSVTLPVCGGGPQSTGLVFSLFACSGSKEFRLGTFTKASHVVADVTGYYAVPPFIVVNASASPEVLRSNDMGTITRVSAGTYDVGTPRDMRGCSIMATIGNTDSGDLVGLNDYAIQVEEATANKVQVEIWDIGGATQADIDFMLVATC